MRTIELTAWLPIKNTTIFNKDESSNYLTSLSKFCKELEVLLEKVDSDIYIENVSQESPCKIISEYLSRKGKLIDIPRLYDYVKIKAQVKIDTDLIDDLNKQLGKNELLDHREEVYIHSTQVTLVVAIEKLLILTELSYPSDITTFHGVVSHQEKQLLPIKEKHSFSNLMYPFETTLVWPTIEQLKLSAVFRWSESMGFIKKSLAVTRLEKTFASYTHAIGLSWLQDGEVLFRCLQGLESFYCDGVGDLRKQLSEKSRLFLGDWEDKKNIVGHLYDLRSKYVHGSCSIEYWNSHKDAYSENKKLMMQFSHGVSFSVRLLFATIQKCIKEDLIDINWSYDMKKHQVPKY